MSIKPRNYPLEIKVDIINAFGADWNTNISDPLNFLTKNKYLIYPVGHHIIIRDISWKIKGTPANISFIYLSKESELITSMHINHEKNVLIVCENTSPNLGTISLYFLGKFSFDSIIVYKPKRKIITDKYRNFRCCSFSNEGDLICVIAFDTETKKTKGVIYNVQTFQAFHLNLTLPSVEFDWTNSTNKITCEHRMLCTSGECIIKFWCVFDNIAKEIKSNLNQTKNYVDHVWVLGRKIPTILAITSENELYIIEGVYEKNNKLYSKNTVEDKYLRSKIDKFWIKQYFNNIFTMDQTMPTIIKSLEGGIIIGSNKGDLFVLEKNRYKDKEDNSSNYSNIGDGSGHNSWWKDNSIMNRQNSQWSMSNVNNSVHSISDNISYTPLRIIERKKESAVIGIAFSLNEETMAVAYASNEIAYTDINNIFDHIKNKLYQPSFTVICEGFHSGAITAMETSIQRPIIVTASNYDKSIRVWNYITGESEYCRWVLLEKDEYLKTEMNILSIALHPNGYYLAMANNDMIWFFHLCFREIRFYGTDISKTEERKRNCNIWRFSNGGHILVAVSKRDIFFIQSFTRETIKNVVTNHTHPISDVCFTDDDYYWYTFGTDGIIYQINCFTFNIERVISEYLYYNSGIWSTFYDKNWEETLNVICVSGTNGNVTNKKYLFNTIECVPGVTNWEFSVKKKNTYHTSESINTICKIKWKKYDFEGVAGGTEEGEIYIYERPFSDEVKILDRVQSHIGKVNKLIFSKDTNWLFSCGDDGNIFLYCIYEYVDGDNITFDNKILNVNQLNTVLDEGWGENVLYPKSELYKIDDELEEKKELILKFSEWEEKMLSDHNKKLKELEAAIIMKKDKEVKQARQEWFELDWKTKEIIEQKEKELQTTIDNNRKKWNEQNKFAQEQIHNWEVDLKNSQNEYKKLKDSTDIRHYNQGKEYRDKFSEWEETLKSKVEVINLEKEELRKAWDSWRKDYDVRWTKVDDENENLYLSLLEKQNKKYEEYELKLESQKYEIIKLKDHKNHWEDDLSNKDKTLRALTDKVESLNLIINALRENVDNKEKEKEGWLKRWTEVEKYVQEKEQWEKYTNKLKTELYKKNVEITAKYKHKELEYEQCGLDNKKLEKSINSTFNQVLKSEKEKKQYQLMANTYKDECEDMRRKSNILQAGLDDILIKIYEAFKTSNKNEIFRCVCDIYKKHLTDEFLEKNKRNKLNIDIQEELENHIGALENNLKQEIRQKVKVDYMQSNYKEQKILENSTWLGNCTLLRVKNSELYKEIINLKGVNRALNKKIDNISQTLPKLNRNNSAIEIMPESSSLNGMEIANIIKDNYLKNNNSLNAANNISGSMNSWSNISAINNDWNNHSSSLKKLGQKGGNNNRWSRECLRYDKNSKGSYSPILPPDALIQITNLKSG